MLSLFVTTKQKILRNEGIQPFKLISTQVTHLWPGKIDGARVYSLEVHSVVYDLAGLGFLWRSKDLKDGRGISIISRI